MKSLRHRRFKGPVSVLLIGLALALPLGAQAIMISEIMFDTPGGDNNEQWIELYNDSSTPFDLTGYSLGWGRDDYTRGVFALVGTIPAFGTWIVGGPTSNAANGNPIYDQAQDLDANLQRGDNNGRADGVALFDVAAAAIDNTTIPIDAVIYGELSAGVQPNLWNELGVTGSKEFLTDGFVAGQSIERAADGSWQSQAAPSPGTTAMPEPGSGLLVLVGLAILSGAVRYARLNA
jgi:hypothetical protein